jgi:hypothetical protein
MGWRAFRWGKDETTFASSLVVISWAAEIFFLVVIVGGVLVGREELFGGSIFAIFHFTAAGLLIVNLSFAAASHAFRGKLRTTQENTSDVPATPRALAGYRIIVVAMWAVLVIGGICIYQKVPYAVIVTEYLEIGLFVAYWLVATRKDWKSPL